MNRPLQRPWLVGAILVALVALAAGCGRSPWPVAEQACDWPPLDVPVYDIRTAAEPPIVDGDVSDFVSADPISLDSGLTDASGTYRLLWDETALYVSLEVQDPYLGSRRQTRDSNLWYDDNLEIMFDTARDRSSSLETDDYKLFVNLNNVQLDYRGDSTAWNVAFESVAAFDGTLHDDTDTDRGYTIEMRVPWEAWQVDPPVGCVVWGFDASLNDRIDSGACDPACQCDMDYGGCTYQTPWANWDGGDYMPDGWGAVRFSPER